MHHEWAAGSRLRQVPVICIVKWLTAWPGTTWWTPLEISCFFFADFNSNSHRKDDQAPYFIQYHRWWQGGATAENRSPLFRRLPFRYWFVMRDRSTLFSFLFIFSWGRTETCTLSWVEKNLTEPAMMALNVEYQRNRTTTKSSAFQFSRPCFNWKFNRGGSNDFASTKTKPINKSEGAIDCHLWDRKKCHSTFP